MTRMPERDTRQNNRKGPLRLAAEQRRDRDRLHPDLHDRSLPGLYRPRAVHRLRLRSQRDLRQLGEHREKLAGADRRRRRRQSHLLRARRRQHQDHLHRRRLWPADPRRRLRRDPAADLPRGQLLRRTRPGQPERAGDRQRRHDPGQPHLDRGPARRSADRAAGAGPRRPQPPARGARHRLHERTERRGRRDPAARGEGPDRRRSAQRRLQVRRRRRPLQRPGRPTPCSAPKTETWRALSPAPAAPSAPSPAAATTCRG